MTPHQPDPDGPVCASCGVLLFADVDGPGPTCLGCTTEPPATEAPLPGLPCEGDA